jgi:hypothetical protein
MVMQTNCKSPEQAPQTESALLPHGGAMSKFPPLNTISLYHSSLGALEQPGEVDIMPQIGSRTSRHSRAPKQKRPYFGYPPADDIALT